MLEGIKGYKGERGLSNYELAVQSGYEGTEAEWLASFGIDTSNCISRDDIWVFQGRYDNDDPESPWVIWISAQYPEGWTPDNTIVICSKIKILKNDNGDVENPKWELCPYRYYTGGEHSYEEYRGYYFTFDYGGDGSTFAFCDTWQDVHGGKFDFQVILMKVDIPQV